MYCKYCGKEISDGGSYCPHCGNAQNTPSTSGAAVRTQFTISEELCVIVSVLLSALTLLTSFMPWLQTDSFWFEPEQSYSLFEIIGEFFDSAEGAEWLLVWGLILIGILSTCMFVYAIVCAVLRKQDYMGKNSMAAASALILFIFWFIVYLVMKHEANGDGLGDYVHLGIGAVVCFIVALIELFGLYYLSKKRYMVKMYETQTVVCPHCGTSYIRRTAASVCPNCNRLPSESSNAAENTNLVLCAYCGTKFEKKGILDRCPQCGRIQPQHRNAQPGGAVPCPHCKYMNPRGAIYCGNCHAQIGSLPRQKAAEEETIFCEMCGKKIPKSAQTCPFCGAKQ